jgi:hypothetical protein
MAVETLPDLQPEKAQWDLVRGNNHHRFGAPEYRRGGGLSFKQHLNKPLSESLWQDLRHCLDVDHICVYGPNDPQWTMGWGAGHATITLNEDGTVDDIYLVPHQQRRVNFNADQVRYMETMGQGFINAAAMARVEF